MECHLMCIVCIWATADHDVNIICACVLSLSNCWMVWRTDGQTDGESWRQACIKAWLITPSVRSRDVSVLHSQIFTTIFIFNNILFSTIFYFLYTFTRIVKIFFSLYQIYPLHKWKTKDPGDINNYRPIIIIAKLSPRYLSKTFCRDSPGTCGLQTGNLVSSEHMGQKCPYLHSIKDWIFTVIRTHLYTWAF